MYKLTEDLLYNMWWYIILTVSVGIVLATVYSCANKPDIMKQKRDCIKGKIEKVSSVYICLEVGGDAKSRIP